jgi:hypothetical protein
MVTIQCSDWGILGTNLNGNLLDKIFCLAGHNSIRCINQNGRALANAQLKDGRDGRAKAIDGSQGSWTAYATICEMLTNEHDIDAIHVQANRDVVFTMLRAAFGPNALGCTLDAMTSSAQASHLFERALVLPGVVILMADAYFLSNGNNPKIEVLSIQPFYELKNTLKNINAITRSIQPRIDGKDAETCIVQNIVGMIDLHHEDLCGKKTQFIHLAVSLTHLLSPARMTPALDEWDTLRLNNHGIIDRDLVAAYFQVEFYDLGFDVSIARAGGLPNFESTFFAVLWYGGPRFCVVNDGTYAFRTPDFPQNL